ncbi:MAG: hypothetical protein DWP97_03960 [Calditrichaeota bacterium]|nr:MAG: hypothetical protein DWP97_03960 [Calditrichota bacterium]
MSRKKKKAEYEKYDESQFIGKTVIIGITYKYKNDRLLGQEQFWGKIVAFNEKDGLKVDMKHSGEIGYFPPFFELMEILKPGVYTLRSTGEEVEDPDYAYKLIHNTKDPEDVEKWAEYNKSKEL